MANYVLCTGSWVGGWYWHDLNIPTLLRQAGHKVFTPTFTGLGDRVHLAHPDIDLNTHIEDILMVLKYESLDNVILVG